jgi:L-ascorbate metabolism protein UlaG (beta-lactamase superfamily)
VTLKLTYLEINSWVWEVQQQGQAPVRILVDPVLVGNLDFGAPWLFDGAKKNPKVKALGVDDLLLAPEARPDVLLITQSLDDHCHVRTLTQLSARAPDLPVVTTPNAQPVLESLPTPFRRVTYIEPGQSTAVNQQVRVLATAGPVLGPPWQRPENGYILMATGEESGPGLLYYEPHCVYDRSFLEEKQLRADIVITPVVKQLLPANFTLVSGQEDAVDLARLLRARYVVPMSNGDVDAGGLLATVLTKQGTTQSFQALLSEALPEAQVLHPTPGVPLQLQLDWTS